MQHLSSVARSARHDRSCMNTHSGAQRRILHATAPSPECRQNIGEKYIIPVSTIHRCDSITKDYIAAEALRKFQRYVFLDLQLVQPLNGVAGALGYRPVLNLQAARNKRRGLNLLSRSRCSATTSRRQQRNYDLGVLQAAFACIYSDDVEPAVTVEPTLRIARF